MDSEKVYVSTIRLYKSRQLHKQAYEKLMQRDKESFKRKDDFIAEAIIHYAEHLNQEAKEKEFQVISDHFGNQNSQMYDILRSVLTEVLDDKLAKLCKAPDKIEIPDEEPQERIECTDRDKNFAAFYNFDDD